MSPYQLSMASVPQYLQRGSLRRFCGGSSRGGDARDMNGHVHAGTCLLAGADTLACWRGAAAALCAVRRCTRCAQQCGGQAALGSTAEQCHAWKAHPAHDGGVIPVCHAGDGVDPADQHGKVLLDLQGRYKRQPEQYRDLISTEKYCFDCTEGGGRGESRTLQCKVQQPAVQSTHEPDLCTWAASASRRAAAGAGRG